MILKTVEELLEDKYGAEKAKKDMEEIIRRSKLSDKEMKEEVEAKAERLAKLGHKEYMAQKAAK